MPLRRYNNITEAVNVVNLFSIYVTFMGNKQTIFEMK
jgi:hypothetical protein